MSRTSASRLQVPTMPDGVEVASYHTYSEASSAVDFLSDHGFPVQNLTIVGSGLHLVERVTGRLSVARVALNGAASGAVWGLFMGLLFAMITPGRALLTIGMGLVLGAGFGMLAGALAYTAAGGRRDFTSQSQVVAARYAVLATGDVDRAFHELQRTPGNKMRPAPASPRVVRQGPTEYGSRPDEKPRFGVRLSPDRGGAGAQGAGGEELQRRREERRADAKRPPVRAEDLRAALGEPEGRGGSAGARRPASDGPDNPFAPHVRGAHGAGDRDAGAPGAGDGAQRDDGSGSPPAQGENGGEHGSERR